MNLPRTRRLQRFASWIATFAIVLAAVAPTVSQALVASGAMGSAWVEVCTAEGMRWVAIGDETPTDAPAEHCVGVCAYCLTHAGSFGLAPVLASSLTFREDYAARSSVHAAAPPRLSSLWSPHQTRAPPPSA